MISPYFFSIVGDEQIEYINFEDFSRVVVRDEVATIYVMAHKRRPQAGRRIRWSFC